MKAKYLGETRKSTNGVKWITNNRIYDVEYSDSSKRYVKVKYDDGTRGTQYANEFNEVKGMTKDDLRSGMVVESKNGNRWFILGEKMLREELFDDLLSLNKDLTDNVEEDDEDDDIYKVYKCNPLSLGKILEDESLILIWERETKTPNQLKLEELEKTIDEAKRQIEELKEV